jgi:hypothetical protein
MSAISSTCIPTGCTDLPAAVNASVQSGLVVVVAHIAFSSVDLDVFEDRVRTSINGGLRGLSRLRVRLVRLGLMLQLRRCDIVLHDLGGRRRTGRRDVNHLAVSRNLQSGRTGSKSSVHGNPLVRTSREDISNALGNSGGSSWNDSLLQWVGTSREDISDALGNSGASSWNDSLLLLHPICRDGLRSAGRLIL